ncbi:MAG: ferredoxin domain-containing protein [Chloroflexia bacterium]
MNGIHTVAELMALAARTAPKSAGQDYIVIEIVEEPETLQSLADDMVRYGQESGKKNFDRDGENVRRSAAVVLIGLREAKTLGLNCGACGFEKCLKPNTFEGEFRGPNCALRLLDMGIALGSAVKIASLLNVDNRIMYRIGVCARRLGLIEADFVMGIPLSATGKSIYFDRPT